MSNKITIAVVIGFITALGMSGCTYFPKKSSEDNAAIISQAVQSGDTAQLQKYFENNSHRSTKKHAQVLNVGNEELTWSELENHVNEEYGTRVDQERRNQEWARQQQQVEERNEKLKAEQEKQQIKIKKQKALWKKFCKATKKDLVVRATVVPINRFAKNDFWAKTMGVSPYGSWYCYNKAKAKSVIYAPCPGDHRSSCAVVRGLPKNVNENDVFSEYLQYVGTVKGQSSGGFNQDKLPVWSVIPKASLKKFGIDF